MSDLILVETQWGKLWLDPEDIVGRTLLGVEGDRDWKAGRVPARADGHFWDGELLLPIYAECARPGTCVILVGANFGQDVGACVQGGARVLAVEADWGLAAGLRQTIRENAWEDQVTLLAPFAAYNRIWACAPIPTTSRSSQAMRPVTLDHDLTIPVIPGGPLDPYVTPAWQGGAPVTLIQVDAQGCDRRVLVGLQRTITRERPVIVFEFEAHLVGAHGDTWGTYRAWMDAQPYTWVESATHGNNWIGRPR